jgi:hypothetical protein
VELTVKTPLQPFNAFLESFNLFPQLGDLFWLSRWCAALVTSQESAQEQKTERGSNEQGFHPDSPPWLAPWGDTVRQTLACLLNL